MVTGIRSPLFAPASRPDRFEKAALSGADAVILDLEDAVAPEAKERARDMLRVDFTNLPVLVRINAADTSYHSGDLAAVARIRPIAILLPKAESSASVSGLVECLPEIPIVAIIESALGLANARQIAAIPGVARLAFGSLDFCADIGSAHTRDGLLSARSELVLASRLAGIAPPMDGVTTQIDDPEIARSDALHARELGMTGKLCIHPRQISPVLAAFAPGEEEIAGARRVLASGDGATAVDGAMVDEPVRVRARAILAAARG
jgi:citrate lyase subunit beta / citryl-CoA lyase